MLAQRMQGLWPRRRDSTGGHCPRVVRRQSCRPRAGRAPGSAAPPRHRRCSGARRSGRGQPECWSARPLGARRRTCRAPAFPPRSRQAQSRRARPALSRPGRSDRHGEFREEPVFDARRDTGLFSDTARVRPSHHDPNRRPPGQPSAPAGREPDALESGSPSGWAAGGRERQTRAQLLATPALAGSRVRRRTLPDRTRSPPPPPMARRCRTATRVAAGPRGCPPWPKPSGKPSSSEPSPWTPSGAPSSALTPSSTTLRRPADELRASGRDRPPRVQPRRTRQPPQTATPGQRPLRLPRPHRTCRA